MSIFFKRNVFLLAVLAICCYVAVVDSNRPHPEPRHQRTDRGPAFRLPTSARGKNLRPVHASIPETNDGVESQGETSEELFVLPFPDGSEPENAIGEIDSKDYFPDELLVNDLADLVTTSQNIPNWLVCRIMERIAELFRNRLPPSSGTQFAVMVIVPESVTQPEQIDPFLAPAHENVNYRFTRPTRFPNQNCRTHAEVVAMQGRPNENFNLQQFYQNFVAANPGNAPRFLILYTWIFPCRACTERIVQNFGAAHGDHPVFNIPTYVGRTTAGNRIHPPLTDETRNEITNLLLLHLIRLFFIRVHYNPGVELEENDNMAFLEQNADELCDTCYITSKELQDTFNCESGTSTPETSTCPSSASTEQETENAEVQQGSDPCCQPAPVNLYITARNQTCRSNSPCGYHDNKTYAWCYLDPSGNWDYCCTGACGNHQNTGYDWCSSGSTWQYCKRDPITPTKTANGKACRTNHQCGFHDKAYAWCYTDDSNNYDYCCTSKCEEYGKTYDWCAAGNTWQKCHRDNLGTYNIEGKQCRSNSPCGFYDGKSYAWCYLADGGKGNCCTSDCNSKGYGYDWCTSGDQWYKCKVHTFPYPRQTYNLKQCKSTHQCGYYGYNYAWCYTEGGGYDYCCTEECGLHGYKYDWCTIGTNDSSNWQYCKRSSLPETSKTAKGVPCRAGHQCDYHGYTYTWCYTDNNDNYDYCCSSTCGPYNTGANFCPAGKYYSDNCCCSKY